MSIAAGTQLAGRYEILAPLGAGGMGEVYRARDLRLGREVAIKVLPEHLSQNPQALSRFEREAKALATLSHPNILAIFDFGTHEGISFAVMELLKGETLRSRLAHSKLNWKKAIEIGIPISEGLAAAHSAGVVHRDLKPENIFITSDDRVRILDFGLVQWQEKLPEPEQTSAPTISKTSPGLVMGTLGYMSPEQVCGEAVDAQTDIFSFGCVLYEIISGNRAFSRKSPAETIAAILNDESPALSDQNTPPDLNQIIQHCLEKKPEKRFQSARDLTFALQAVSSGAEVAKPWKLATKFRFRAVIWIAALIVLFLITGSLYLFIGKSKAIHSIAIMPFANGSQNPDAEYLSDGISDSIIFSISQLPNVRVMARDTAFTYKGKEIDPRKIGQELNVEAVVTGRVVQQGNTLIIRAHLVKVADGTELWGDQYNRKLADVLAVQEEISREISENLRLRLTGQEHKLVSKHYTQNSEAYQLYLKGRYHRQKDTPEDHQKSIEYFNQAIQKDPNYALAYTGLADTYTAMTFEGLLNPKEAHRKIEAAAKKAAELDPDLGEAVYQLSSIKWNDWDFSAALKENERAIALNPNNVFAHRFYSQRLRALGRFEEAITEAKQALELDPLWLETNVGLGATYYWAGQYDQAIEQYKKTIHLDPNFANAHDFLADAYARKGMFKEAIDEERQYLHLIGDEEGAKTLVREFEAYGYWKARQLQFQRTLDIFKTAAEHQYVSPIAFAAIYAFLNRKDEAFALLEKAYQERSGAITYIKTNPEFENLRSDPRFQQLLQRIGLPL